MFLHLPDEIYSQNAAYPKISYVKSNYLPTEHFLPLTKKRPTDFIFKNPLAVHLLGIPKHL